MKRNVNLENPNEQEPGSPEPDPKQISAVGAQRLTCVSCLLRSGVFRPSWGRINFKKLFETGLQSKWDRDANPTPSRRKSHRLPPRSKSRTEISCISADGNQRPACGSRHRGEASRFLNTSNRGSNHRCRSVGPHKNRSPPASLVPPDQEFGCSPGGDIRTNPLLRNAPIGKRRLPFGMESLGFMKRVLMPSRRGDAGVIHRQICPEGFDESKLFDF